MKCKNCGAEIPNNIFECPYCDAAVEAIEQPETNTGNLSAKHPSVQKPVQVLESESNPIVGKKYSFTSTVGTNLAGIFNSKISSNVEVAEDRIFINIKPKRFNKVPAIMFEDITGIDTVKKINLYYWVWIIISVLGGLSGMFYLFIFTIIFIFCGLQSKITISQRNGVNVVMYSSDVSSAEKFKEDMRQVTKIQ